MPCWSRLEFDEYAEFNQRFHLTVSQDCWVYRNHWSIDIEYAVTNNAAACWKGRHRAGEVSHCCWKMSIRPLLLLFSPTDFVEYAVTNNAAAAAREDVVRAFRLSIAGREEIGRLGCVVAYCRGLVVADVVVIAADDWVCRYDQLLAITTDHVLVWYGLALLLSIESANTVIVGYSIESIPFVAPRHRGLANCFSQSRYSDVVARKGRFASIECC